MRATLWAAAIGMAAWAGPTEHVNLSSDQVLARVTQAEDAQAHGLHQYSATRRYTLRSARNGNTAEMTVRVDYRGGSGKKFEVLASNNADGVFGHVFSKLLETETDTSRNGTHDQTRISAENYAVQMLGAEVVDGRPCYVLELHPKRRSRYLLNGKAWVDADDFAIVRIAGRPSANVSFWIGKPYIEQSFQKVGDFWLASRNHSVTDAKLFGRTELTVESAGYRVPGVDNQLARRAGAPAAVHAGIEFPAAPAPRF